ncbi:MAG TPA: hypothetical protein VMT63_12445 [Bacteroidales bacterium]|nr:hypothetical protein [Bacteroidales bacterium]
MKTISKSTGLIVLLVIIFSTTFLAPLLAGSPTDTLRIFTTPSLAPLVMKWSTGFREQHPGCLISVDSQVDLQKGSGSLIISYNNLLPSPEGDTKWKITIAHDAAVPVVNTGNPAFKELMEKGISPETFGKILKSSGNIKWSEISARGSNVQVTAYLTIQSASGNKIWTFARTGSDALSSVKILNRDEFFRAVKADKSSVGFCNISELPGSVLPEGLAFLPIDRNGNGKLDNFEMIYDNPETLLRGILTGKFPHSLCVSICAAAGVKPSDENMVAFLKWLVAEGGKTTSSAGYTGLIETEKESGLLALTGISDSLVSSSAKSTSYSWLILIVVVIAAGTVITVLLRSVRRKTSRTSGTLIRETLAFNEKTITAPAGLYFDKSHTWAFMERDGLVRLGINDFMQHVTGNLTEIKMREPGEYIRRGEKLLTVVKEGKQLNLYAPVSGVIKSQNTDLYLDSSLVNASPYTDGWVYLIEPKNWSKEIQMMFPYERFRDWINSEFIRLKDFFAASLKSHYPEYAPAVLQDGGEITDNPLEELSPEIWEDFQTSFIDRSR